MPPLIDGKSIDRETIEESETLCEECGTQMRYEPRFYAYHENDTPAYHAFAVCPNSDCENEFEF